MCLSRKHIHHCVDAFRGFQTNIQVEQRATPHYIFKASPPAGHYKQVLNFFQTWGYIFILHLVLSVRHQRLVVDNSILNHSDDYQINRFSLIIDDFSKPKCEAASLL